jgi:hypothetical protein
MAAKGPAWPVKAKIHATSTNQMVLACFNPKSLIFTSHMPRGTTVKAKCITEALDRFMKILKKTPALEAGDCWFN